MFTLTIVPNGFSLSIPIVSRPQLHLLLNSITPRSIENPIVIRSHGIFKLLAVVQTFNSITLKPFSRAVVSEVYLCLYLQQRKMSPIRTGTTYGLLSTLIAFTLLIVRICASDLPPPGSVKMRVVNHAGAPIEIFWINKFESSQPLIRQTEKAIRNNTDTMVCSCTYLCHQLLPHLIECISSLTFPFTDQ
jgi:hypothetical protein